MQSQDHPSISQRPHRTLRAQASLVLMLWAMPFVAQCDERVCWQYETSAGVRKFVAADQENWLLEFPNGNSAALKFRNETPAYIELQNVKNKNVLRLFADHGVLQRGGTGPFRRFSTGSWREPSESATTRSDYLVRVVYFIPTDREPTANYEEKIHNIVVLISEIMTAELRVKGYETDGPQIEMEDGRVKVHVVNGEHSALHYNQNGAWKDDTHTKVVFSEVSRRAFDRRKFMTLIFSETYEPGPSPKLWPGHLAVASATPPIGGIGLFSAWILRDEFACADDTEFRSRFFDETPIEGREALGSRRMNSPRADFMEDGVGGALHELTHMFGAVHNKRAGNGVVMSQGFRSLRWNVGLKSNPTQRCRFSDETAAMLMASRFLNRSVDRSDNAQPEAQIIVTIQEPQAIVDVSVTDDRGLRLIQLVEVGPSGRQVIESRELEGTNDSIRFRVNGQDLARDSNELLVLLVDNGGNLRREKTKIPGR